MATLAEFRASFPEFARAADSQVEAFLARALVSVPATTWGVYQDEGQMYLAAHLLALSPYGQNSRLESDDKQTTYGLRYRELQVEVAAAWAR